MASTEKPFKVLIAGGGVAGLTLATMLERFDIDYLVLESHGHIAPAVGASIGLFPNGLRILDQIDRYEPLLKFWDGSKEVQYTRDKTGKPVVTLPNFQTHLETRFGYPLMFFDRQWLLQSLYDQLRNKDKVLLNHKVSQIHHFDGGVEVSTTGGQKIRGSIIVGADGLHSAVRKEMYRIGKELEPEYFPPDEEESVPCHYLCSFGIAQNVPGWHAGDVGTVLGEGHSQLVVSGPEDRVYWFFFEKLPETKYGSNIPTCTKEMEQDFAAKHANTPITPKVTFGDVYSARLSSTLTPLHEYVCKKWFFKRMIIIGDSAHKPNPIGGQGGNSAVESAAELINALLKKRDSRSNGLNGLKDQDITEVFTEMQAARQERAGRIIWASNLQQSLCAYEKPGMSKFVWQFLVPLKGDETSLAMFGMTMARGNRLNKLPLRHRPRAIPFNDELPAEPIPTPPSVQLLFAGVMACITFAAGKASKLDFLSAQGVSLEQTAPLLYASAQLISPILIYTIEGHRLGNRGTLLALPSLFLAAMQYWGVGRIAPIYGLMHALFSFDLPTARFVRPEVAKALIPALTLGYLLPSAVMGSSSISTETWATAWKYAPPVASFLVSAFAPIMRCWQQRGMTQEAKEKANKESSLDRYKSEDVPTLKLTYSCAFILQATAHLGFWYYYKQSSGTSLSSMMLGSSVTSMLPWSLSTMGSQIAGLAKSEMGLAAGAWLLSNLHSVWKLRSLGYIKTSNAIAPVLGLIAGQALVGPGATWVGLWYWRESVLSGLKRE